MKNLKNHLGLILIILLSYFAVKPLFLPGFFTMHDDIQVARVFEMGKALKDGMFPVRWVSDLGYGYGYPIFNFYAPLSYYLGGSIALLGFDALFATKMMIGIGIMLAGLFMYLLAKEFWGSIGGLVAGLFYVYAPYHAVDIYVRGDVAEFWAYAFIPLIFLGLWKVYKERRWKWVVVGSLGYAGVILSHNLTAMMITPFVLIVSLLYCYIVYKDRKLSTVYCLLSTVFLGILISSFYWIPALLEMRYTNVLSQISGGADFKDHFVCIAQLWNSQWGFGGSVPGCIDGMSFKIGKLHIILSFLVIFFTLIIFIREKCRVEHYNDTYHYSEKFKFILFLTLGFLLSIILTIEVSKPLWEGIYFMAFFQYPWRFLILSSFFSSLLSGAVIWLLENQLSSLIKLKSIIKYLVSAILLFFLFYFNLKLFQPQTILSLDDSDYTNENELKWRASRISDEYLPANFLKPKFRSEITQDKFNLNGEIFVADFSENHTQRASATFVASEPERLLINITYFPAWKAYVDEVEVPIEVARRGMTIFLPSGKHKVEIFFQETLIELVSNILSLSSVFFLVLGIIISKRFQTLEK